MALALLLLFFQVVSSNFIDESLSGSYRDQLLKSYKGDKVKQFDDGKASHFLRRKLEVKKFNVDPLSCPTEGFNGVESTPWGYEVLGVENVPDQNIDKIKICLIDSGFDASHPDFKGLNVTFEAFKLTDKDYKGSPYYSFFSNSALFQNRSITLDPTLGVGNKDWAGTGTASLGIIAAVHNKIGIKGIIGNPNVKIHVVKGVAYGLYYQGQPTDFGFSITGAVKRCVRAGAKVIIINSFTPGAYQGEELKYFKNLYTKQNVLVFAPSGWICPRTTPCKIPFYAYPASYRGVISVAGIDMNLKPINNAAWNSKVSFTGPSFRYLTTIPTSMNSILTNHIGTGSCVSLKIPSLKLSFPGSIAWGSRNANLSGLLSSCGVGASRCKNVRKGLCLMVFGGGVNLYKKVLNCQIGGAKAAVIYQSAPGVDIGYSLGKGYVDISIPVIIIDYAPGVQINNAFVEDQYLQVNLVAKVVEYKYVSNAFVSNSAVAATSALVWSNYPLCKNDEILNAMKASAYPLGPVGIDPYVGYGLPQADKAVSYLAKNPCRAYKS